MPFKEKIINYMNEKAYKPLVGGDLAKALGLTPADMDLFKKSLRRMEAEGLIVKNRRNRYGTPRRMGLTVGTLQMNARGFGFVIPEEPGLEDIYIAKDDLNTALNGDLVLVRPGPRGRGVKAEGEIIRVLRRVNRRIVGTVEKDRHLIFVIPDDRRFYWDVFIRKKAGPRPKDGQKVVVRIIQWPKKRRNPEGEIVEVLGRHDDPGIDLLSIIKTHDLSTHFPARVKRQLGQMPARVLPEDLEGREDFRGQRVFTIDGADAKDLDDAVSIERVGDGYRLGVHIADVSHYVTTKSALDVEALKRGTSVYLMNQVIPMLPPELSNGICSLNPREVRLTLSTVIDFDREGKTVNYKIVKGIIESCHRATYDEVTDILEGDKSQGHSDLTQDIEIMAELAKKLTKRRFDRGSLDFNIAEAKVILDDENRPLDVRKEDRQVSHRIIEEFMIAANEVIAEHIFWLKIPGIYRVHEEPDEGKILATREMLHNLGYSIKTTQKLNPKSLQQVLEDAVGKPEERLVNTVLLRSLKQARYFPKNLGHFGLASRYYTHFTAPIRRYPDLVIHRILSKHLQGEAISSKPDVLGRYMEKVARLSSERERIAEEAEREARDLKIAEYMSERIGEKYDGIISSVTSFGFFVELANTVEGLVHVSNIPDDFYHYNEKNLTLMGERSKRVFKIGSPVRIKVSGVDLQERNVDFELV